MKKSLAMVLLGTLALMGCDSRNANAQNPESVNVGNPGSANMVVIEEGYEVVAPVPAVNNAAQSADWSQEGNVDVAPLPANNSVPAASAAPQGNKGNVTVDETVLESSTPNSVTYDVNESVNN